jgi:transcriptional antiterminator RfaH
MPFRAVPRFCHAIAETNCTSIRAQRSSEGSAIFDLTAAIGIASFRKMPSHAMIARLSDIRHGGMAGAALVVLTMGFAPKFIRDDGRWQAPSMMDDRNSASTGAADVGRWFVAFTQARRELLAVENLQRQGWRVFLPFHVATRRHARQFRTVRAPVFPRYVFVRLDLNRDRWRSVNGTLGVQRLVMAADRPLPVPVGVVETMMRSLDRFGNLKFADALEPGSRVRLASGPFANALGILNALDASGRVEVLLEILGGLIKLKADVTQLSLAG